MSERTKMIAGNWKMHKTLAEARALAREIVQGVGKEPRTEVVLAPPYTALAAVAEEISGSPVLLAAQDTFWEEKGAFTGAIAPGMLADVGCTYVIVGHSERRQHFGDDDEAVNRKVHAVLAAGLRPIMCVGETLGEREDGKTFAAVETQVLNGLAGFPAAEQARLVIAYEPVWAIGTGKTATPTQAQEVHRLIRNLLADTLGTGDIRILYGGSVTPENAASLMAEPDIDGALVGGASLKAASFLGIIRAIR
jgi:triosephosphate isomerase|uniref:Triosephosphate isomerase n=1 Tax=Desulfobacca acetoxidans TaxID=60893 RepID=A0A7V6DR08_9BACT